MKAKHLLFFILFLMMVFVFTGCKPGENCPDLREERYYLFNEEKHLHPYTGYDTLKFKHANGNIYTFYGQGLDSGFSIQSSSTSPDCGENILTYRQAYFIRFQSDNYGIIEFKKYLTNLSNSDAWGNIGVSRDGVNQFATMSGFYRGQTNNTTFFDSMVINNKTYYKVVTMPYDYDYNIPNKAYFNQQYGILKIIISNKNNDVLERVPD